jgi:putative serine protease PepD
MHTSRSFVAGAVGGIIGAALLFLVLFLLGVTDVKKETTVTVTAPATFASPSATGSLTPEQIYNREATGVVEITSTFASSGTNIFGQPQGGTGVGSGFVVDKQGYILTNAHVVSESGRKATKISVTFKGNGTQTRTVTGTIVGVDPQADVAAVKVNPAGLTLNPLPLGDSNAVQVGEPVVAIGNPLALDFTLTSGIVSAIHRNLVAPSSATIFNGIQTDAAINPGNSGGPLIDASGRVIGINESIAVTGTGTGGTATSNGLGFAVPIDTAKTSFAQLKSTGQVKYPWLGVRLVNLTPDLAKTFNLNVSQGALVDSVTPGGPAAKAGINGGTHTVTVQGQQFNVGGDVITALNGKPITSADQLVQAVSTYKPGDKVTLTIERGGTSMDITVTLGNRPAQLQ